MPYTLMKGLGWILLALLLGVVIGWLLRSVAAKRQVARARKHHVDTVEMERLRGRIANLEPVVAERDQLRAELAEAVRARAKGTPEIAAPPPRFLHGAEEGGEAAAPLANGESTAVLAAPDLAAAVGVIGRPIALDDLKVIEGIGPKIEELCHGIGIRTWHDLSITEVSLLRTMLSDAGARFRTHDPATWPEQARLLAAGRWVEFKALIDSLDGGRSATASPAE
jgi:predicted flap endonuclease-1-like 5' DNA nuclease